MYLQGDLSAPTAHSVTDPDQIRERLAGIRAAGFCWTREELEVGINSVAAPIFNGLGEVLGAVHLHGPAYRFPGRQVSRYEDAVVAAARAIDDLLGPSVAAVG